ncbi:MAG: hypothetical protein J3Q66DRAFT_343272, partial [Benniella sp.]
MSPSSYLFPNQSQHSVEQPLAYQATSENSSYSSQDQNHNRVDAGVIIASPDASSYRFNNTLRRTPAFCSESFADIGSQPLFFDSPNNSNNAWASRQRRNTRVIIGGANVNSGERAGISEMVNECIPETGSYAVPHQSDCITMNRALGPFPIPDTLSVWLPSTKSGDDPGFEVHAADNHYSSDTLGSDEYLLHAQHSYLSQLSLQLQHDDEQNTKCSISCQPDDLPSAICRQEDSAQDVMVFLSELQSSELNEPASSDTQPFSDPPEHHDFEDDDHRYETPTELQMIETNQESTGVRND